MGILKGILAAVLMLLIFSGCSGVKEADPSEKEASGTETKAAEDQSSKDKKKKKKRSVASSDDEPTSVGQGQRDTSVIEAAPVVVDIVSTPDSGEELDELQVSAAQEDAVSLAEDSEDEGPQRDSEEVASPQEGEEIVPPVTPTPAETLIDLSTPSPTEESQPVDTVEELEPLEGDSEGEGSEEGDSAEDLSEKESSPETTEQAVESSEQPSEEQAPDTAPVAEEKQAAAEDTADTPSAETDSTPVEQAAESVETLPVVGSETSPAEEQASAVTTVITAAPSSETIPPAPVVSSETKQTADIETPSAAETSPLEQTPVVAKNAALVDATPSPPVVPAETEQAEETSFFSDISEWFSSVYNSASNKLRLWIMEPAFPSYYEERGRPYPTTLRAAAVEKPHTLATYEDEKSITSEEGKMENPEETVEHNKQVSPEQSEENDANIAALELVSLLHEELSTLQDSTEANSMGHFLSLAEEVSNKEQSEMTELDQVVLEKYLQLINIARDIQSVAENSDDFQDANAVFDFVQRENGDDFSSPSLHEMQVITQAFIEQVAV